MDKQSSQVNKVITLNDGSRVTIRPIRPEDAEIEWNFVHNLSAQSRYFRFLSGKRDLDARQVEYFTQVDFSRHTALIATIPDEQGGETEIAVARYFSYGDDRGCEYAIVVADEWQHRGLGYQLMNMLIADARERGLHYMDGVILAANKRMLAMARKLGFVIKRDRNDRSLVNARLELC